MKYETRLLWLSQLRGSEIATVIIAKAHARIALKRKASQNLSHVGLLDFLWKMRECICCPLRKKDFWGQKYIILLLPRNVHHNSYPWIMSIVVVQIIAEKTLLINTVFENSHKMSHLNFHAKTYFCIIWIFAPKMALNVARFARYVLKWDIFKGFSTTVFMHDDVEWTLFEDKIYLD